MLKNPAGIVDVGPWALTWLCLQLGALILPMQEEPDSCEFGLDSRLEELCDCVAILRIECCCAAWKGRHNLCGSFVQ